MATGWYGIPGTSKATKVHYVLGGKYPKPICGAKYGPLMQFQHCAAGFEESMVECARCRRFGATPPFIRPLRKRRAISASRGEERTP